MRARQCAGNADLLLGEVHVVSLEREPLASRMPVRAKRRKSGLAGSWS